MTSSNLIISADYFQIRLHLHIPDLRASTYFLPQPTAPGDSHTSSFHGLEGGHMLLAFHHYQGPLFLLWLHRTSPTAFLRAL